MGAVFTETDIPAEVAGQAAQYRTALIEAAVEQDADATEAFLAGTMPTEETLKSLIRKGTCNLSFVPVLCGSAFRNKGIQPMLDAVVDYLPSPADVGDVQGIAVDGQGEGRVAANRAAEDTAPFSALVFKVMSDPVVGSLAFGRIYSGTLTAGSTVLNPLKGERERIGRMLQMQANAREDVRQAYAGDIVAFVGLKHTATGDTLCDTANPIVLERIEFPEPVIEISVEPKSKADQEKLAAALLRMAQEDPAFRVSVDGEAGRTVIKGIGELHLEILGRPAEARVSGRCQVRRSAGCLPGNHRAVGRGRVHSPEAGGCRQPVRPREAGARTAWFRCRASSSKTASPLASCRRNSSRRSRRVSKSARETGILAGFPVTDLAVALVDGSAHDIDSSALAFELAGASAFREGLGKARPVLLEPIMSVEVVTPEEFSGNVVNDLRSRRGRIEAMDQRGNAAVLTAMAPLAKLFGYVNTLRSISQGRAHHAMQFDHYEPVPQAIADEVRAKLA